MNMKNLMTLAILIFALMSCNRTDDNMAKDVESVRIDSVQVPLTNISINTVQPIITFSNYQQGCEGFYGYDYVRDGFTRTITPYKFRLNNACGNTISVRSQISFSPKERGVYTFRFYNGDNNWIVKTITVE